MHNQYTNTSSQLTHTYVGNLRSEVVNEVSEHISSISIRTSLTQYTGLSLDTSAWQL